MIVSELMVDKVLLSASDEVPCFYTLSLDYSNYAPSTLNINHISRRHVDFFLSSFLV